MTSSMQSQHGHLPQPPSSNSSLRHNPAQPNPLNSTSVLRYEDSEEYDVAEGHSSDDQVVYENSVTIEEVRRVFQIGKMSGQATDEFGARGDGAASYQGEDQTKSPELLKSENDYYGLFLDPENEHIYYRKVFGRDDFIRIESIMTEDEGQHEEDRAPSSSLSIRDTLDHKQRCRLNDELKLKMQFDRRNRHTLFLLREMLILDNFSWTFQGEADSYRRRPFPLKFLHPECSDYPVYAFSSELSKAFDEVNGIPTKVDLSEFAEQIENHMRMFKGIANDDKKKRQYCYENELQSLVISTGEFINDIIRDVYMKFKKFKLQPRSSSCKLALKVDGFREYFYGNYQLLQYERVRWCLRKKQTLKLIMTEIRTDSKDPFFPPLFKMDKKIHYPIIHVKEFKYDMQLLKLNKWLEKQKSLEIKRQERELEGAKAKANKGNARINQFTSKEERNNDAQFKAELEKEPPKDYYLSSKDIQKVLQDNAYNKDNDRIPFKQLENSSQYFWYSPVPNLFEEEKQLKEELKDLQNNHLSISNEKPSLEVHNGLSKRDRIQMGWVNVPKQKKKISITKHRFQNGGTTAAKQNQQIVVESGECNWFFKFKIISIERINKIFEEIQKPIATDNKETVPKNVTLDWNYIKNKKEIEKMDRKYNQKREERSPESKKRGNAAQDDGKQSDSSDSVESDQNDNFKEGTGGQNAGKQSRNGAENDNSKMQLKDGSSDTAHFPKLISMAMKKYQQNEIGHICEQCKVEKEDDTNVRKIQQTYQSKNFSKILKKKKIQIEEEIEKDFHNKYIPKQFSIIKQPYCNFSHAFHTMQAYKNILAFSVGSYTPTKIKIECTLYHGCEKLVEEQVIEQNSWFSNNIHINKQTNFGKLRYCQLPVKTKLSINVILSFDKPGLDDLTIGCVSTNLFDEKQKFKSGRQALNLWPFYQIDKRLGCMKEYKGREFKSTAEDAKEQAREDLIKKIHNEFAQIILEFDTFIFPMVYSSRDLDQIQQWKYDRAQPEVPKLKKRLARPSWLTWNKLVHINKDGQGEFVPPTTLKFESRVKERLSNYLKCDHNKESHAKKNEDEGVDHHVSAQKKDQGSQNDDKKSKDYMQLITINQEDEDDKNSMLQSSISQINKKLAKLKKIFQLNPLDDLSKKQKKILFKTREHYSSYPQGLPLFLRSVEWNKPLLVNETYKILKSWALMEPEEAICLLDAKYPDEQVRKYAVERISHLSDDDIALYMLQFTQALIYEEQHFSPLSDMLIERALKNPYVVGQSFFWALKSNLYLKTSYERFYLLLESFLMLCGKFRTELLIQIQVNKGLKIVQQNVMLDRYKYLEEREHPWTVKFHKPARRDSKEGQGEQPAKGRRSRGRDISSKRQSQSSDHSKRGQHHAGSNQQDSTQQQDKQDQNAKEEQKKGQFDIIKEKARINLLKQRTQIMPIVFNLASDPKNLIKDFKYPKLTVFKSKKVPMLLTLQNAQKGGIDTRVMFKNGDDMRQDILTLQIIAIMDKMWLASSLNLRMTPYKVTGTDCMQGFLEFNENTVTLAMMQYAGTMFPLFGNSEDRYNVFNTFNNRTIMNFFEKEARKRVEEQAEKDGTEPLTEEYIQAEMRKIINEQRKVFAKSCAGYCVASYVLGLGDRHADNILINIVEGHFIHIDFGHFLCNYKKTRLYQRETDPFVFTPEIAYFINGQPLKRNIQQKLKKMPKSSLKAIKKTQEKQTKALKDRLIGKRNSSSRSPGLSSANTQHSDQDATSEQSALLHNRMNLQSDISSAMDPMLEYSQSNMDEPGQRMHQFRQSESKVRSDWTKSELFLEFEEDCCKAYNILRKNGNQLINLFLLMLSAGMPELNYESDILPMVRRLQLDLTEQEASNLFKKEIVNAMNNKMRRFDNLAHNIKAKYL